LYRGKSITTYKRGRIFRAKTRKIHRFVYWVLKVLVSLKFTPAFPSLLSTFQ
jgi:hypothetical protein